MVLRQVPSHVPGGGAGEHQQGVDDQQAHPGHGDGHHHGDGGGKEEVFPDHPDAPAVSQGLVNGREHHLVKGSDPQHQQAQQNLAASAQTIATARQGVAQAREQVRQQQEQVKQAQTNLGYATITSPIDGVVLSKSVEEGQTVAASFSTPELFTIAKDLTNMQVVANVDEADIGEVKTGERVSFTVDAYPDDTFTGRVTQVRQEATTTNNVVTYEVVISAPNPDLKLKPRLTANVTIYTLDRKNVLSVPARALRFTPEKPLIGENDIVKDCESEHKLWTREGNTFIAHPVTVGISNGVNTEIVSGIDEGATVVTEATIGRMPGEGPTADMPQEPNGEKSPFMPGPPGSKKKNNSR